MDLTQHAAVLCEILFMCLMVMEFIQSYFSVIHALSCHSDPYLHEAFRNYACSLMLLVPVEAITDVQKSLKANY